MILKARLVKTVNLTKRVKTPGGPRFCTVARSTNGRIKANYVEIAGREEDNPEGSYYIEWWDGAKRLRRSVGKNALAAEAKRHQQEQILTATAAGIKAGLKFADDSDKVPLANAVSAYLADTQLTKKKKTLAAYTTALDYFLESCKKQYVADVDRRDLLQYSAFLRDEKDLEPRTVYNKFENLMTFLKAQGIRVSLVKATGRATPKRNQRFTNRKNLIRCLLHAARKSCSGMNFF